jgi:murein DD-endopeptidase MepM/ murein hydrolase activator NlpD
MSKKFTLLVIPDDDSGTRSYNINGNSFKYIIIFLGSFLIFLSILVTKLIPRISHYDELNEKYNMLAQERLKVLELSKNLKRINQMDKFVRNSLGAELNFSEKPEILDSVLMLIPDDKNISYSDNIPSIAPIQGYVSQRMGSKISLIQQKHGGIDIVAKEGAPIQASASGIVVFSGWTYEMGNLIIIHHGDGYFTHYGHNQINLKSQLDFVKKGEVIGLVGNTGISTGPHLHFEIWKNQQSIDPLIYFPEYDKTDLTSIND